jgi:hypothetical protein
MDLRLRPMNGELQGVAMIEGKCPNCGHGIFGLAKACPRCAAARGRLAGMVVAGALGLLLVATATALVAVLRWDQLAAATETGVPADAHIAAGSTADLGWLSTAMSACDAEAAAAPGRLLFLVTPLTPVDKDVAPWHAKSINEMGNGLMLRRDDTLAALKSGALRLYPADYAFRILDQASDMIYKWRPALGVAKFSTAEAGTIATFKVQFGTAHSGDDAAWGGSFARQSGACHWVNAIISN